MLRHLEGRSFPLIAQRMERTVDGVKKLWARALNQLARERQVFFLCFAPLLWTR
jgi:DNA-directed RNA polymerase specialized sigma24 family protein